MDYDLNSDIIYNTDVNQTCDRQDLPGRHDATLMWNIRSLFEEALSDNCLQLDAWPKCGIVVPANIG